MLGNTGIENFFEQFNTKTGQGNFHPTSFNPYRIRQRRKTSAEQVGILETVFTKNAHPDRKQREALGEALGMTPKSVQIWFQNKRAKEKAKERQKVTLERSDSKFATVEHNNANKDLPFAPLQEAILADVLQRNLMNAMPEDLNEIFLNPPLYPDSQYAYHDLLKSSNDLFASLHLFPEI